MTDMYRFQHIISGLLLILLIQPEAIAQSDPVTSTDSLFQIRPSAKGIERAKIDLEIARYHYQRNTDSLNFYIEILEKHIEEQYDTRIDAFVKKFKGYIAYQNMDLEKSMNLSQESMILFRKLNDFREMGWISVNLGTNYYRLGDYASATEFQLQALAYFEQVKHKQGIAFAYNELGRISYKAEQFMKAREYFESALEIYNEMGLSEQSNKVYNNLGIMLMDNEENISALKYFFRAAKGFEFMEDHGRAGSVYGNIAICFEGLQNPDSAMIYARRALKKSLLARDEYSIITGTINLGYFLRLNKDFDSSLICFNKALEMSVEKNMAVFEETVYGEYSDLFADMGNYKLAYEYYKKEDSLHNQIINEESKQQIEELLFSYKQKLREKELIQLQEDQKMQLKLNKFFVLFIVLSFIVVLILIRGYGKIRKQKSLLEEKNELLNNSNIKLENSEKVLKEAIENKNKLFSIVAHDLRNPIAAVYGFSEFLINNFDELDGDSKKEYIEHIFQASVQTISLLENLLLWARSQMDQIKIVKRKVAVVGLIRDSAEPLISSLNKKKVDLRTEIKDDFYLNVDVEMIKAVLRNLISNAIKFSFPGKSIVICSYRENDNLCLSVSDKGTGIKPEILRKLFTLANISSEIGTSNEKGSGLGLIISKDYTEKNGGKIRVQSEYGSGSTFTICFPENE